MPKSPSTAAGIHCPDCDDNGTLIYDHCKNHPHWVDVGMLGQARATAAWPPRGRFIAAAWPPLARRVATSCPPCAMWQPRWSPRWPPRDRHVSMHSQYAETADGVDDPRVHLAGARVFSFGPTHDRCYQPPAMENVANFHLRYAKDSSQARPAGAEPAVSPHVTACNGM